MQTIYKRVVQLLERRGIFGFAPIVQSHGADQSIE
jgi:hypothetical protein